MTTTRIAGSFRDPAGFLFRHDGVLYRQVNPVFADDWEAVAGTGLFEALWDAGLLVRHEVLDADAATELATGDAHVVLRPDELPHDGD